MTGPVYPRALASRQIAAGIPGDDDRAILHNMIITELVTGTFTERSRTECVRIIDKLAAGGCDAVALACTEIPILLPPDQCPLPALDSTRLLAHAALSVAVGRQALPAWRGGVPTQRTRR